MYEIWADNLLIHSDITPLDTVKVINPTLTLEDSSAGSLEMVLPPTNVGYSQDVLKRMVTNIVVKCNGEFLWGGRILQDDFDFWNNRKMICEGELAFLNDSIQPPKKYDVVEGETTIESFFYALIDIHNSQVNDDRKFEKGMVTVTDGDIIDNSNSIYRFTNYETTLECVNDKLLDRLGGHIRVRHQDGKRYLDYISDDTLDTNSQIVRFGVNLLDFSKNIDMSELSTVIVPRGERLELEEDDPNYIEGLEPYLTVESLGQKTETITNPDGTTRTEVWHDAESMFVKNESALNNFGWVSAVVDWDSVTDADTLYSKAAKYLKDEQYEKMTLEIKALDLRYLSDSNESIKFLSKLRCISEPHGMDHTFIVSKMQLDLTSPSNCIYTLGTDVKVSLTQAASRVNSEVQEQIDKIPSKHEILKAAEKNAYQVIMGHDGSYVHLIPGEDGGIKRIEVTDGPTYIPEYDGDDDSITYSDPFPDSTHRWVWTVGGLGHIGRPNVQAEWGSISSMDVALQMTGEIVADRITVGILRAINNRYEINTQNGFIKMQWAQIGPWYLNYGESGLTDNHYAWVTPTLIACGAYGGILCKMQGTRSGDHSGYLEVGVNDHSDCIRVYYDNIERTLQSTDYAVFESGSDERIKKDIESLTLEEALKVINAFEPLTFKYKDNDKEKHYGFTAQRIEKVCSEEELPNPFVKDMTAKLKTVDYNQFVAPLIKVVQEQQKEIEELKSILQNKK